MERVHIEEKGFEKIDFMQTGFARGDYEYCTFTDCNLAHTDLSHISFAECTFNRCNLSKATLNQASFKTVWFNDCALTGLRFEHCNPFLLEVHFDSCTLHQSSFFKLKLKKAKFLNSSLQGVDFAEADLSQSTFENCDLTRAVFVYTILEKADFRTSYNYTIDPELNRLKKAKFSRTGISGLLEKYEIEIE